MKFYKLIFCYPLLILLFPSCDSGYVNEDGKVYLKTHDENVGKKLTEVKHADLETFKEIDTKNHGYIGIDKNHVYHNATVLKGADPLTH